MIEYRRRYVPCLALKLASCPNLLLKAEAEAAGFDMDLPWFWNIDHHTHCFVLEQPIEDETQQEEENA